MELANRPTGSTDQATETRIRENPVICPILVQLAGLNQVRERLAADVRATGSSLSDASGEKAIVSDLRKFFQGIKRILEMVQNAKQQRDPKRPSFDMEPIVEIRGLQRYG